MDLENEFVSIDIAEASEICVERPCYDEEESTATPRAAGSLSESATAVDAVATFDTACGSIKLKALEAGGQDQSTPLEVMWQRLVGRGQTVAERMNIDMHKGAAALECHTREEGLIRAFRALDIHSTGSLGANALRALVTLDDPKENAKQVS
jgi:hypothetical protein